MATKGSVSLADVETAIKSTVDEVKNAATTEVTSAVQDAESDPVGTVTAVVAAVSDAPATVQGAEDAATSAVTKVADEATQALDDQGSAINDKVQTVEHDAIDAAVELLADAVETRTPPVIDHLIDMAVPAIETRLYAVTSVITVDFEHRAEKYIVELAASAVKGLHDTAVKALIAAKILAADGHKVIESALNVLEVTGAKALFHEED